jgi:hypothetical protein
MYVYMSLIREKRIINLNAANATQFVNGDYLSNVVFDFPNILSPTDNVDYVETGVGSAEIVASFYNVDTTNNVFNYRVSAVNYSITVPPGSYNYNSLITQLTTSFALNAHTFSFTLNRNSNILTMTLTSAGTWNQINDSSIYYILGFNDNTTYNIVGNTITFPNLFNLIGIKNLKISSSKISLDSYDSKNTSTTNLLATISVNVPNFNLIIYSNLDSLYSHCRSKYISTIDIQIKDDNDNYVNFNGVAWNITINLILYRQINKIIETLKLPNNTIDEQPVQEPV